MDLSKIQYTPRVLELANYKAGDVVSADVWNQVIGFIVSNSNTVQEVLAQQGDFIAGMYTELDQHKSVLNEAIAKTAEDRATWKAWREKYDPMYEAIETMYRDFNNIKDMQLSLEKSLVHYGENPPTQEHIRFWVKPTAGIPDPLVALAEAMMGQKTVDGGEVFNDYENNRAYSTGATAVGLNNTAATMGYKLDSIKISGDEVVVSVSDVDLSEVLTTETLRAIKAEAESFGLDNTVSFQWHFNFDFAGNVKGMTISQNPLCTEIRLDKVPPTLTQDVINGVTSGWLWFPTHPEIGNILMGPAAHAEGADNKASQYTAHVEGRHNIAAGKYSHAGGMDCVAGYAAFAHGNKCMALSTNAVALGGGAKALASGSFAAGNKPQALGHGSIAIGNNTISRGQSTIALGAGVEVPEDAISGSAALGKYNIIDKDNVFTVGIGTSDNTRKTGLKLTSDGRLYINDGYDLSTDGVDRTVRVITEIALSRLIQLIDNNLKLRGNTVSYGNSKATKTKTFAGGNSCEANGNYSVALGNFCNANTEGAIALGVKVNNNSGQVGSLSTGRYNVGYTNSAFEVGCGTGEAARKNAFTVFNDGSIEIGSVKITPEQLTKLLALIN